MFHRLCYPMGMELQSSILRELQARGFIHQCTDLEGLDLRATEHRLTAYVGFDCTAPSLHIGNLTSVMMLRWWQKMGHRPIVLLGGATTRIGDPSGKEEMRKLLSEDGIKKNIQCIKKCFRRFLDFRKTPNDAQMVNNRTWLNKLKYIDFLRDYGCHFSVNRMLGFDSVKTRLEREQNLSFLEFNYMVFQAYDFLELSRKHNCILQIGGADQWGNIVNGIELARKADRQELFGLTSPLITTANGQKMGKTVSGAVWLDPKMTDPSDYWQYWRNVDDKDVGRFLRLFTDKPIKEIIKLENLRGHKINIAKETLADETTRLLHGKTALKKVRENLERFNRSQGEWLMSREAIEAEEKMFEERNKEMNIKLRKAMDNIVTKNLSEGGIGLLDALREFELAISNSEARRFVRDGAVRINGKLIKDEKYTLTLKDAREDDRKIQLSVGKRRHRLISLSQKQTRIRQAS